MRLILKILAAPLVVALTLFVWICTILLYYGQYCCRISVFIIKSDCMVACC